MRKYALEAGYPDQTQPPELAERLVNEGATAIAGTPDEFMAFLKKEIAPDARIVQASGMTAGY